MRFTEADINDKIKKGLIKGVVKRDISNKKTPKIQKPSIEKLFIRDRLEEFCKENGFKLETEFRFHPKRRYRSDWAIPGLDLCIEYEGLFSRKSRHTTIAGFTNDTLKYNMCVKAGYDVLRYTAGTYKDIAGDLLEILKKRK